MPDLEVGPGGREPVKSPLARLASVAMGVLFLPVFVLAFSTAPACMGFGDPALRVVNACPAATAALGSPVSQSWMGLSCGNAETEDDDGNASWSMPVAGPSGRGTLDIRAIERDGRWEFGSLVLTTGERTIDVVSCAAGGSGEVVLVTHRELAGTVATVVGPASVAAGARCTVTLDPSDGAQTCRVAVTCGGTTLYGGGTQGYGRCMADASGALTMRDGHASADDGDPMIDLRLASREVVITDQTAAGTWVVSLTLD